jgi:predicted dehydrogenase
MNQDHQQNKGQSKDNKNGGLPRRDLLKGLATLPFAGALLYGAWRKRKLEHYKHNQLLKTLSLGSSADAPAYIPSGGSDSAVLRIGVIGTGGRGMYLMRSLGFNRSEVIDDWAEAARRDRNDKRLEIYMDQENLNVEVTAVCDVFNVYVDRAVDASANVYRTGIDGKKGKPARVYRDYHELLQADDIDAVIIATPDHWHAQMAIEAAKAGKHIYLEKPMSLTVEETYAIEQAVLEHRVAFQLGHQNRQIESHMKAIEVIEKDLLGKITLIETFTNRNSPNGAWVYNIHNQSTPENIDWKRWLGPAPDHPFSAERFHRWRCWWDYSTGLTGDLFTHEFDAVNQVMKLGIPHAAAATGGIYFFKDGRTVPDVLHVSYEYPERDLNLLYSATLANSQFRKKTFYGHDGYMELGNDLVVYADTNSTRYKEPIADGIIPTSTPMITHVPGKAGIDAISSATERYFAQRGLLYTYRGGRQVDTAHLHLKEWLNAIRYGSPVSCGLQESIEEAIAAHMGTISYRSGQKVYWDPDMKEITT